MPQNDTYIWLLPTKPSTLLPITGDIKKTAGLWVRRILENPQKSLGKYAGVITEVLSFDEILKAWSHGTGKPAVVVECTDSSFNDLWGVSAEEFKLQLKFHELVPDMIGAFNNKGGNGVYVSGEELGITAEDIGDLTQLFETLKGNWD
ncbi:sugar transporter [Trichoderma arundinaceum]|uniref:Sugar transporter n=1 Tax=Trichoderma arundinaceum TaxID=490622 RepID=A0A395NNJ8_TRIAR|nr:sugar transporter [Trichoderma arundinaceum]